jgi:hypothetical protein
MTIIRDILTQMQTVFSDTILGRRRAYLFVFAIFAIINPFGSARSSNLLVILKRLFGVDTKKREFYTFMASGKIAWQRMWEILIRCIPSPLTDGRLLAVVDDCINEKTGKHIFGCGYFHNHATKVNMSAYPWSQNIVVVGLLKMVKGRWACLPLLFRFYVMKKDIAAQKRLAPTDKKGKSTLSFKTKLEQAAVMLFALGKIFVNTPILVVTDSWFGNNGLLKLIRKEGLFNLLSRLRSSTTLYDLPAPKPAKSRGAPRKYGAKLGTVGELALRFGEQAKTMAVTLYGKKRELELFSQVLMCRSLRSRVRVVWVYRRSSYVALYTTDLSLSVAQIIEYYGARWKIEACFKELKQDIGSQSTQVRTYHSVHNHLNFCMIANTLTWIHADQAKKCPTRQHAIKGRGSFAFSDARKSFAKAINDQNYLGFWLQHDKPANNSFLSRLLKLAA